MLESYSTRNPMQYHKLTAEEQKKRGILGRLVGVIADFVNPTRNGRKYTEELWDKTFNNPIMKEKLENRCCLGELGHPEDRQEIDIEKVAICLAEVPKKGDDGKLYGVFDILDTPNGRILKTLCDYGTNIGVSSRGSGDVTEDYSGEEIVEPDTYECECWDAVLLPAVKSARPAYVTESLDTKKTLKMALQESLANATDEEKKVMKDTMDELKIDYKDESLEDESVKEDEASERDEALVEEDVITPEKVDNIDSTQASSDIAAEDNGAELERELQEALKQNIALEAEIKRLQEKLSVCYTKETRYENALAQRKTQLTNEQDNSKKLSESIQSLKTALAASDKANKESESKLAKLNENLQTTKINQRSLSESLNVKDKKIQLLESKVSSLTEDYSKKVSTLESEKKTLNESVTALNEELKQKETDSKILRSQLSAKVKHAEQLTEKYKSIAKTAVERYITVRAKSLGISSQEIKSRLNENYSFNDIDKVCDDLQKYKLTVNSLPFNIAERKNIKARVTESKEIITSRDEDTDDDIDATLVNFIK